MFGVRRLEDSACPVTFEYDYDTRHFMYAVGTWVGDNKNRDRDVGGAKRADENRVLLRVYVSRLFRFLVLGN